MKMLDQNLLPARCHILPRDMESSSLLYTSEYVQVWKKHLTL